MRRCSVDGAVRGGDIAEIVRVEMRLRRPVLQGPSDRRATVLSRRVRDVRRVRAHRAYPQVIPWARCAAQVLAHHGRVTACKPASDQEISPSSTSGARSSGRSRGAKIGRGVELPRVNVVARRMGYRSGSGPRLAETVADPGNVLQPRGPSRSSVTSPSSVLVSGLRGRRQTRRRRSGSATREDEGSRRLFTRIPFAIAATRVAPRRIDAEPRSPDPGAGSGDVTA